MNTSSPESTFTELDPKNVCGCFIINVQAEKYDAGEVGIERERVLTNYIKNTLTAFFSKFYT